MGQLLVGHGLLIAAMSSSFAEPGEVIEVLNSNGTLAEDVRKGRLITV